MKLRQILDEDAAVLFEEINKGWSSDTKYYIETKDEEALLLRVSEADTYERKRSEFEHMKTVAALGIPMSHPLDFVPYDGKVYSLFTWMEGTEAGLVLPQLAGEEQYQLGFESGEILKKIHSIPALKETEKWEHYFSRKINRNIKKYQSCELSYEKDEKLLQFISANRHLIENRPSSFQHGDYHTGNMIISPNHELAMIDFNRFDFGDPWEEFNRIVFTAEVSPLFATGQIDGYFSGKPPMEFFKLLALYICTNTLNALPWALSYSQKEVETMKRQAASVLEWYADMQKIIPNWYQGDANKKYGKK